jgi:hypothetical protein
MSAWRARLAIRSNSSQGHVHLTSLRIIFVSLLVSLDKRSSSDQDFLLRFRVVAARSYLRVMRLFE